MPVPDIICQPCDVPPCPTVSPGPPGPQGNPGQNGTNGTNGLSAYSISSLDFTVPDVDTNVVIEASNLNWMAPGQIIYIQNAGYYSVDSPELATFINLGYAGNATVGTNIPLGQIMSPGGIVGPSGSLTGTAGGEDLTGTYPDPELTTTGVLAGTGTKVTVNAKGRATSLTNLVAGDVPNLDAAQITSGIFDIARGGTSAGTKAAGYDALSPASTLGDLTVHNGTNNVRLPVGSDGQVLISDSGQPNGVVWNTAPAFTLTALSNTQVNATPYVMASGNVILGVNVGSTVNITLLPALANGRLLIIKDRSGAASGNNITVVAGAGDTIQGSASKVITTDYGFLFMYYDSTDNAWYIIGSA